MAFFAQTGPEGYGPLGAQLGSALGDVAAKTQVDPQVHAQRNLLSKALDEVAALAKDPNASPIDIMLGTAKAGAGIPGFEKYANPLMERLLNASAYQQGVRGGGQDDQSLSGKTGQPEGSPSGITEVDQEAPQARTPAKTGTLELGQFIPVNTSQFIGPDQAEEILKKVGGKGGDVNLAKQRLREFNAGTIEFNDLVNSNVDRQFAQSQRQLQMEQTAKTFLDQQLPDIPDMRKNMYYNMLREEMNQSPDLTSAYQKVSPKIQAFEKQMEELPSKIPEPSPFGFNNTQKSTLRRITKNIMDTDPLAYPVLENIFTQEGHKMTDVADTLKPLPSEVKSITDKAGDYRGYVYPGRAMTDKGMEMMMDKAMNLQEKEVPQLAKKLAKNWDENLSLINIYTDLKVKGWFPEHIQMLFEELKNQNAPFSQQQEAEIVQLGTPPEISWNRLAQKGPYKE